MSGKPSHNKGLLVVLSAASGTGKTTVANILIHRCLNMIRSISVTTRKARRGETEGKAYRFVTDMEFDQMIQKGELLEWAKVFNHRYGTPLSFVKEQTDNGKDVLLVIDVQGGMALKKMHPGTVLIFLVPPSGAELRRRIKKRGSENPGEMTARLHHAAAELAEASGYDYIVINDRVSAAAARIKSIVDAEKSSATRMTAFLEHLRRESGNQAVPPVPESQSKGSGK